MFFTLVEGQTRLVQHLSAVLSPFRASSEAGMMLTIPPNHPALTEAVSQWLSAHHVCVPVCLLFLFHVICILSFVVCFILFLLCNKICQNRVKV